jgi:hypothetical protein
MWIHVQRVEDQMIVGWLENDPIDMPAIKHGDPVRVPLTYLIDCIFHEQNTPPDVPKRRSYWERCMVDACIVEERSHVDYLYREAPDMGREGDQHPDSGWRIRGTDDAITEDERLGEKPMYLALGKVLNADYRWLHLIDREIGCAFQWDADRDDYIELE